jgi:hypothetical protein
MSGDTGTNSKIDATGAIMKMFVLPISQAIS